MACQVGITTDPDRRRREWQNTHPWLRNWQILGNYPTKTLAQRAEDTTAAKHGCHAHAGGDGPEVAIWYLYYFNF